MAASPSKAPKQSQAPPQPVDIGRTPTYKVDYKLGININYRVTLDEIAPYVPAPLTPIPMRMLESETEPKYLVSLYLAVCGMNDGQDGERADVFTYIKDANGNPGMLFLSVLCAIPPGLPKKVIPKFLKMQEDFFLDDTGKCPVPHKEIDRLSLKQQGCHLKMGDTLFESSFKVKSTQRFHHDFVVANSQIFHNGKNKTVNYFNQEFISAPISEIDLASVTQLNTERFHELCRAANLDSVQKYGNDELPITWYFKARL